MSRRLAGRVSLISLVVGLIVGAPGVASAQVGQGPPTPVVTDLAKIPVGSWAQYSMTVGTMASMKMRIALVAKSAEGTALEMAVEGGPTAQAGKVVTKVTLKPGPDWAGKPQKLVIQVGANDPMEMQSPTPQGQFAKPDPKTFLKDETVKVAGGSFKSKHYRTQTAPGDSVDTWVAESVAPIGLVKMVINQKSNPMVTGAITMELTSVGKDAKPGITKTPKPFDQATLMKQVMAGAGGPPAK